MSRQQVSKTDWNRVRRESAKDALIAHKRGDGPYDPNDEKATEKYLSQAIIRRPGERGPQKAPTKVRVSLRLSREVVEYFRATGDGWQTRMDGELLEMVHKHKVS